MSSTVLDELLKRRIDELAERVNEGLATEEERSEYEAAIDAADITPILVQKSAGPLR